MLYYIGPIFVGLLPPMKLSHWNDNKLYIKSLDKIQRTVQPAFIVKIYIFSISY